MKETDLVYHVNNGLSTYDLSEIFNCSSSKIRYWLRKYGINTKSKAETKKLICINCPKNLTGRQTKYCSNKCKNDILSKNPNNYKTQKQRGISRKLKLIKYLGGKCYNCGYNKNLGALNFHHLDPSNKTFSLDQRKCSNTNMKSLMIEVKKCEILCSNCHMEEHHPHLNSLL